MKGNCRKRILTIISALLLLVSVTTAWILDDNIREYRFVTIDYVNDNTLKYSSLEINAHFLYFEKRTESFETQDGIVNLKGIVPNELLPFRIRIWNASGSVQSITIMMTGITTTDLRIFDKLFVGVSGGYGYTATADNPYFDVTFPEEKFICLSDAIYVASTDSYTLNLYDSLIVPDTGTNYVELNGYFWLNRDADLSYSDISVIFQNLRIIL